MRASFADWWAEQTITFYEDSWEILAKLLNDEIKAASDSQNGTVVQE